MDKIFEKDGWVLTANILDDGRVLTSYVKKYIPEIDDFYSCSLDKLKNEKIKNYTLGEVIKFLNYGTLDVKGNMILVKYINNALINLRVRIGGI